MALAHLGRMSDAKTVLQSALNIDPNDSLTLLFQGKILMQAEDFLEAQRCLEKARELNPDKPRNILQP